MKTDKNQLDGKHGEREKKRGQILITRYYI